MKSLNKLIVALLLFSMQSIANAESPDTLSILFLNDTHGHLAPSAPRNSSLEGQRGGIARAASIIGQTKMTKQNVLTLHAGDYSIGDLGFITDFGGTELMILKALGVDAMTLGNHEYDLTPQTLNTVLDNVFFENAIPLLSANTDLSDEGVEGLRKYISPYIIKQYGELKVGIFGMTTPETNLLSQPDPAIVNFNIVEIATKYVDTLYNAGCNVVICLSHLGINTDYQLGTYVPGIHFIIGGHDHFRTDEPIVAVHPIIAVPNIYPEKTYIMQAEPFYYSMGSFDVTIDDGKVEILNFNIIDIDASIPEETTAKYYVDSQISGVEEVYGPMFSQQCGYISEDLDEFAYIMNEGFVDTKVGNLVADAYRAKTNTDVAIVASGSTATVIPAGSIVAADLYRAVGYGFNTENGLGFRIATFNLTGENLWMGIETVVSSLSTEGIYIGDEYFPQVSGMKLYLNMNNEPGSRVQNIEIAGNQINPMMTYSVTGNEFLLMFLQILEIPVSDIYVYPDTTEFIVLLDYVVANSPISIIRDRIMKVEDDKISNPLPINLQNYPNPFEIATTIKFKLERAEEIELSIYDIQGKQVDIVAKGYFDAGDYNFNWQPRNAEAGLYYYQIKSKSGKTSKAMIYIK